jgi:superfamily I DNA and/or RNA helicase
VLGKTTFSTRVLHLQLLRRKRVLSMAATNQAVNNIASRTFAQVAGVEDDFLLFRFWTERLELDIVKSTDPTNIASVAARITKGYSANIGYDVDRSLANAILQLAGLKATTNKKTLELRPYHQNLGAILSKKLRERTEVDRKELNSLLSDAMNALIKAADMIFTTTTLAGTKPIRKFVALLDIVCVDEAACATELEIPIGWKGDKPVILAADVEQLLPPIFSDGIKDEHGVLVNSFVPQLEVPLICRLRDADWPYVDLREQRRMPPGQFDPANHCIYANVEMAEGVTIELEKFEMARKAEAWSITLCSSGIYATGENLPTLPPSERNKITPALVAINNSCCCTIPGGTSKANTAIAHFVLAYIMLIKIGTGATNGQIVIVVPYLQQRRLYIRTILAALSDFGGITVATANSFMGWEKSYVFVDLTASENLGGKAGFVADIDSLSSSPASSSFS